MSMIVCLSLIVRMTEYDCEYEYKCAYDYEYDCDFEYDCLY